MTSDRVWPGWFASGAIGLLIYLVAALDLLPVPEQLLLSLVFLVGPLVMVAFLAFCRRLRGQAESFVLDLAGVFGVVAFSLFTLMLIVQQSVRLHLSGYIEHAESDSVREMLHWIELGVDPVQLGMDVAFDVFFCLAMLCFAVVFYRLPHYGRVVGISGIALASGLLVLNLWTFPRPPASVGLIDLGAANALWWLVVIVQAVRAEGRKSHSQR